MRIAYRQWGWEVRRYIPSLGERWLEPWGRVSPSQRRQGRTQPWGMAAAGAENRDKTQQTVGDPWEPWVDEQKTIVWWHPHTETIRRKRAVVSRTEIQGMDRTLDLARRKSFKTRGDNFPVFESSTYSGYDEKLCSESGLRSSKRDFCSLCRTC